jgi:hypothetical protein
MSDPIDPDTGQRVDAPRETPGVGELNQDDQDVTLDEPDTRSEPPTEGADAQRDMPPSPDRV